MVSFSIVASILTVLLHVFVCVGALIVDNEISGDPELVCDTNVVTFRVKTRKNFEGHLYVKGNFSRHGCRVDSGIGEHREVSLSVPFGLCGMKRTRSELPNGMFITTQLVLSFHPNFITKVDRVFNVSCFYMAAQKIVTANIDVNMLPVSAVQTQNVSLPVCSYQILSGGPDGLPVKYAVVGQTVYHKWSCSPVTKTDCMKVTSCFVDDGNGQRFDILDQNGCANDPHLLNNLDYLGNLIAGQEASVFKYAEKSQLFFQCQLTIMPKALNEECPSPDCLSKPAQRARRSGKSAGRDEIKIVGRDWQLLTRGEHEEMFFQEIDSLPLSNSSFLRNRMNHDSALGPSFDRDDDEVCMAVHELGLLVATAAVLAIAVVVLFMGIIRKSY